MGSRRKASMVIPILSTEVEYSMKTRFLVAGMQQRSTGSMHFSEYEKRPGAWAELGPIDY